MNGKMISLGVVILLLAAVCQAQVPFFGGCSKTIVPKQNFDVTQYLGTWYEQEKYFAIFQFGGKCVQAKYSSTDGKTVQVNNLQYHIITGRPSSIQGTATAVGAPNEARLQVVFPSVPFQIPAPYWVLDTDYTSYAVVYSCNDFGFFNTKFLWLLTRDRNAPVTVMQKAYQILDNNKISRAFLIRTDQQNCPA